MDAYQRTSVKNIYPAGDRTGRMPLSSVASLQGRKIAYHALGYPVTPLDYSNVAAAVFTSPEIASVGLEDVTAADIIEAADLLFNKELQLLRPEWSELRGRIFASVQLPHLRKTSWVYLPSMVKLACAGPTSDTLSRCTSQGRC